MMERLQIQLGSGHVATVEREDGADVVRVGFSRASDPSDIMLAVNLTPADAAVLARFFDRADLPVMRLMLAIAERKRAGSEVAKWLRERGEEGDLRQAREAPDWQRLQDADAEFWSAVTALEPTA